MLRMALSAVAVLLLGLFAYLFFNDYFRTPVDTRASDMLSSGTPPTPEPIRPQHPIQPVVNPVPPVQPAPVQPAPVVQPPPIVEPAPVVAQPEVTRSKRTHVVQRGDTLSSISRQHFGTETHFGKIASANGLKNRDRIRVGQVLILPDLPMTEAAQSVEDEPTTRVSEAEPVPDDFEPIPPTLNIVLPKK